LRRARLWWTACMDEPGTAAADLTELLRSRAELDVVERSLAREPARVIELHPVDAATEEPVAEP